MEIQEILVHLKNGDKKEISFMYTIEYVNGEDDIEMYPIATSHTETEMLKDPPVMHPLLIKKSLGMNKEEFNNELLQLQGWERKNIKKQELSDFSDYFKDFKYEDVRYFEYL
jgi:hypothetical protein